MRVLLSGYYGFGNAGDEAVLQCLVSALAEAWPELHPVALSADPADTERQHGLRAVSRWRPDVFLREVRQADLFLSGGGSLFQDATSARSLCYYLAQLELARAVGTRTAVAFQGLGPLRRLTARVAVTAVLQDTSAILWRDPDSAQLARSLGILAPPTLVAADPAVLLDPASPAEADALLKRLGVPSGSLLLGVSLRECAGFAATMPALAAALAEAARRFGTQILLMPLYRDLDRGICRSVQERLGSSAHTVSEDLSPTEWVTLISRCRAVVSVRLHALIFATAAGVPALGLEYDPKVTAFLTESGQLSAGNPASFNTDALLEALQRLLDEQEAFAAAACNAREKMRQSIRTAITWLTEQIQ
jgi:polysaccharide pyruvyl transferase CsaB